MAKQNKEEEDDEFCDKIEDWEDRRSIIEGMADGRWRETLENAQRGQRI